MHIGLLCIFTLTAKAAAESSVCTDAVGCPGDGTCFNTALHLVSMVCFGRQPPSPESIPSADLCQQHVICQVPNKVATLHLSTKLSSVLSTPGRCLLTVTDSQGRHLYNSSFENGIGATALMSIYGNVTMTYKCPSSPTSTYARAALDMEYFLDSSHWSMCGTNKSSHFSCDCLHCGCIPSSWVCNGQSECGDGSDEYNCPKSVVPTDLAATTSSPGLCGAGEVLCGQTCTSASSPCIIKPDCSSSAEDASGGCQDSEPLPCGARNGTFKCVDGAVCIPASWRCDQSFDCPDNSDETDCEGTSVRVVTAAVIGSLVCSILVVIAAGCTCKLYTLRMMQEQRRSRRGRRYESPMTAIQNELLRRQAPPPSYDAAMRPSSLMATRPLDDVQRELLAHIEAVATAVRAQRSRHHHHHQLPSARGNAVAVVLPLDVTAERASVPRAAAPAATAGSAATSGRGVDEAAARAAAVLEQLHPALGRCGSTDVSGTNDNDDYELVRAAAVREQLDQFLPTLPGFRCAGRATDNVRITASLTASYERSNRFANSEATAGRKLAANPLASPATAAAGMVAWIREEQQSTCNAAFVASDDDDEPLLLSSVLDQGLANSAGPLSAAVVPAASAQQPTSWRQQAELAPSSASGADSVCANVGAPSESNVCTDRSHHPASNAPALSLCASIPAAPVSDDVPILD